MAETHINSYYAATANDRTRYPRLEGAATADVCVVGGGFSGVATALTLAERGYSVVVLEANVIGWGASGRNGGQVIGGLSGEHTIKKQLGEAGARMLRELHYRGNDIIEERVARYGIDCDLKHGWLEAAARPRHFAALRQYYDDLVSQGHGAHLELIEPDAFESVLGTRMYHGGLIDRRSGHVHPLNLLTGEARAAASLGVAIHEDSEALRIEGGAKPFVETAHGRVEANTIVLACESGHRFERGRLRGAMFPTGSYIIATEPLDETTATAINPRDLAVCDSNVVLDYFRLSADRRMIFGGRCNYSNRDPRDIAVTMRPRLVEIFPQLAKTRIAFSWGGRIAITLNRAPMIGRLEPNLYYMQGYCGHGVNATHIAAEIVSDAICGTTERFDLFDRIRHWHLPVNRWTGNQMLALGMLYYRLRDLA
jgi:glycine/D-amino acid oxidase-like deaminating enzyme